MSLSSPCLKIIFLMAAISMATAPSAHAGLGKFIKSLLGINKKVAVPEACASLQEEGERPADVLLDTGIQEIRVRLKTEPPSKDYKIEHFILNGFRKALEEKAAKIKEGATFYSHYADNNIYLDWRGPSRLPRGDSSLGNFSFDEKTKKLALVQEKSGERKDTVYYYRFHFKGDQHLAQDFENEGQPVNASALFPSGQSYIFKPGLTTIKFGEYNSTEVIIEIRENRQKE